MTQRQLFISTFFRHTLTSDYVLLKFTDGTIAKIDQHTDLDILIKPEQYDQVMQSIKVDPNIFKIKVECKASMNQVFIFFKDHSFLQIDFLFGFYRKSLIYLDASEVMEHAVRNGDHIRVCANHHMLEHIFLFQFLNQAGIPSKYTSYFKQLPPQEFLRLMDYLNDKYNLTCSFIDRLEKYDPRVLKGVRKVLNKHRENKGLFRIKSRWIYAKDVLKSIRNKRGFTITFSGVDGAGKSTILREIREILEVKYRRNVIVLRHRPSLLPILSSFQHGKEAAEKKAAETLPRQGKNKSRISSAIRFAYYYMDYLLGQFYIKAKYHWRGYAVLYDRYYFDFIIDGKRSNINLPSWIPKFFNRFVYQPPLNLFLYADPSTILQRKKELPAESIVELTQNYKHLFNALDQQNSNKRYIALENIDKGKTLNTIIGQYVELQ